MTSIGDSVAILTTTSDAYPHCTTTTVHLVERANTRSSLFKRGDVSDTAVNAAFKVTTVPRLRMPAVTMIRVARMVDVAVMPGDNPPISHLTPQFGFANRIRRFKLDHGRRSIDRAPRLESYSRLLLVARPIGIRDWQRAHARAVYFENDSHAVLPERW